MATWSDYANPSDAGPWRVGVDASVTTVSDTQARIDATEYIEAQWAYEVRSQYRIKMDDGDTNIYDSGLTDTNLSIAYQETQTVAGVSNTITRGASARTITVTVYYALTGGYGDSSCTASYTVTVPAVPTTAPTTPVITDAKRTSSGGAQITVQCPSNASTLQVQRQAYGTTTWTDVYNDPAIDTDSTSDDIIAVVTDTFLGRCTYRARVTSNSKTSSWSATYELVAMGSAYAPTLVSPASGAIINNTTYPIYRWVHNPRDGSTQTKAQVGISTDGGSTYTTHDISGDADWWPISLDGYAGEVTWRARTAGADGTYGPWSSALTYTAAAPPNVTITSGTTTDTIPLTITWTVSDSVGTQTSAVVTARYGNVGDSITIDGDTSSVSLLAGLSIPNAAQIIVQIQVTSTTGLTSTVTQTVTVSYTPPATPAISVEVDATLGQVIIGGSSQSGTIATDHLSLWRGSTCLAANLSSGSQFADRIAPLDVPLQYIVRAHAANGATADAVQTVTLPSKCNGIINFGVIWTQVAMISKDMEVKEDIAVESSLTYVNGHEYQVAMYGEHTSKSGTIDGIIDWITGSAGTVSGDVQLTAWRDALEYHGDCCMRLPRGERRRVSLTGSIGRGGQGYGKGTLSAKWTEVDGGLD